MVKTVEGIKTNNLSIIINRIRKYPVFLLYVALCAYVVQIIF